MMTLDEVARVVLDLDGTSEIERYGHRAWAAGRANAGGKPKVFAWERPFSKADLKRFGSDPVPAGDIVAVSVGDLHEEAVLAAGHKGVFTISHFDGYAAVLVQLELVPKKAMRELLLDGYRLVSA